MSRYVHPNNATYVPVAPPKLSKPYSNITDMILAALILMVLRFAMVWSGIEIINIPVLDDLNRKGAVMLREYFEM